MNRLLKLGLAVLAASSPLACSFAAADAANKPDAASTATAAAPADISGSWVLTIRSPRGTQEPILKIEKAGDKFVGALTDPRGRPNPVKDVEYKAGDLTFQVVGERQGQKFVLQYTAKIAGDKLKGKLTIVGRNLTIPFEGRRESLAEGVWKIAFVLESGQKLQPSIHVKYAKEKFTGEYIGISGKKVSIPEVKFQNGELSFDAADHADDDLVFHYDGKVTGDKIKGAVTWKAAGNQKQSLKFEGEKFRTLASDVAGTWKLKVPTKNGPTFEATLALTQTGGSVAGTYTGESGDTPVVDGLVLGDELTFEVTRQKDGKSYKLRYQGKVSGDTLKGNVDYAFDGMTGYFDFEAKRVAPATPAKP
jgi:hypothetical protein